MTEKELMDLGFEQVWVMREESDNKNDFYYFRKELIKDFTIAADYIEGTLTTFVIEPNFIVWDLETLKELIDVFSKIKNAEREASISKENG